MMAPKIALVALVLLAIGAFLWTRRGSVSSAEARGLVQRGATLVDVRTPNEYAEGHIAGAVNIPVQELAQRMNEVGSRDAAVVVYCRSGVRSRRAAEMLKEAGFLSVHDLGGMSRW
jgi:phage shock protein E